MLVIPAIDLKDGRCVRLRQGDMAAETVYSDDVSAVARKWQQGGATLIHVVDLNGAVDGEPRNLPQIEAIIRTVTVKVQVGLCRCRTPRNGMTTDREVKSALLFIRRGYRGCRSEDVGEPWHIDQEAKQHHHNTASYRQH